MPQKKKKSSKQLDNQKQFKANCKIAVTNAKKYKKTHPSSKWQTCMKEGWKQV